MRKNCVDWKEQTFCNNATESKYTDGRSGRAMKENMKEEESAIRRRKNEQNKSKSECKTREVINTIEAKIHSASQPSQATRAPSHTFERLNISTHEKVSWSERNPKAATCCRRNAERRAHTIRKYRTEAKKIR
jgi:hypothetical protein